MVVLRKFRHRPCKKFTSKNERSEASAVEAMSYMLSSDALLFRNIPLTFTKKKYPPWHGFQVSVTHVLDIHVHYTYMYVVHT